ncbi:orexigenic neuropeptide QRFP [Ctenodactylus gundi]
MRGPSSLPYLLLLPLGACFPLPDRRLPEDAVGIPGARIPWGPLARGRGPWWLGADQPQVLLLAAGERLAGGRGHSGFRVGRQEGVEATSFLPAGGEKATDPLGSLAEDLSGYSRRRGGFSFRFGRR